MKKSLLIYIVKINMKKLIILGSLQYIKTLNKCERDPFETERNLFILCHCRLFRGMYQNR